MHVSSFSFSIFSGSGVQKVQCSVDEAAFTDCTSPFTVNGLSDAFHKVSFKAIDNANNEGIVNTREFGVDTIRPSIQIVSERWANGYYTLTFSATDQGISGVQKSQCRVLRPGEGYATENYESFDTSIAPQMVDCTSPWTISVSEGYHEFYIRAIDNAGNNGSSNRNFWGIEFDFTSPPAVQSAYPKGSIGYSISTHIHATFNKFIDENNPDLSFRVTKSSTPDAPIDGTIRIEQRTVSFIPSSLLDANTQYTATINGVKDADGMTMTTPYTWTFTTGTQ